MAKREKHVFSTGEIPHLWAHKSQAAARNPRRNLYFEGDTIYSYGSHFPIARHVTNSKGKPAILFTTRTYSSTTAGHISAVRNAVNGLDIPVFHVYSPARSIDSYYEDVFAEYFSRINEHLEKAKSRNLEQYRAGDLQEATDERDELIAFCKWLGVKRPKGIPSIPKVDQAKLARDKVKQSEQREKRDAARSAKWARWEAIREEERKKREIENARTLPDRLAAWDRGEYVYNRSDFPEGVRLRLIEDGRTVETSMGARILAVHARRALKLVRAVKSTGREWTRNGETLKLGPYQVDRVTPEGTLYAGCHVIEWAEIERFAPILEAGGKNDGGTEESGSNGNGNGNGNGKGENNGGAENVLSSNGQS